MAYPKADESTPTKGHSSSAALAHLISIPTGTQAGDLLLLLVAERGYSQFAYAVFRTASSTDASSPTFTHESFGNRYIAWICYRITGWTEGLAEGAIIDVSANPNAGAMSGPWGSAENLWISFAAWEGDFSLLFYSASYDENQVTDRYADADNGVGIAASTRELTAATDDPTQLTLSGSTYWAAICVVIRPGSGLIKNVSDALTLSDAKTTALAIVRSFSDGLIMGDSTSRIAAYAKAVADAIALGDTKATVQAIVKAVADNIHLGDSKSLAAGFGKLVVDSLALGESISTAGAKAKAVADAIALGDSKSTAGVFFRAFADAMALGDAKGTEQILGQYQEVSDALGLGEALATHRTLGLSVSDGLAVGETLYPLRLAVKEVSASIVLEESVTRVMAFAKAVSDALTLGESISTSLSGALTVAVADGLTLGESVATVQAIVKAVTEPIALGESVVANSSGALQLAVSDGISLGETVSTARAIVFAVSDGLELVSGIDGGLAGTALSKPVTDPLQIGEYFRARLGGGWFGPDGPCECGCECTCDEARDDYGHVTIIVFNGAPGGTWYDQFGVTYQFPGISSTFHAIDVTSCTSTLISSVTPTASSTGWDNYTPRSGGYFNSGIDPSVILMAAIQYVCVDGVYDFVLSVSASYTFSHIPNTLGFFSSADHPSWDWEITHQGGIEASWIGRKTWAGETHYFEMSIQGTAPERWHILYSVSSHEIVVSLGTPPFDPMGLLVGSAAAV